MTEKSNSKTAACTAIFLLACLIGAQFAVAADRIQHTEAEAPLLKDIIYGNALVAAAEQPAPDIQAVIQKNTDSPAAPSSTVVHDEDKAAIPNEQDNALKAGKGDTPLSPLGISYKSNETATRAIEKNISFFAVRLKERFSIWLERSAKYAEIMKEVLREKQVPEELVFLPIVESGFNLNAYSRARAVGPWQFIAATGKRYGLVIDWWRDERKDPVKSTQAAADYLKDLYQMFGSWKLALAAYNAGEGRIAKAMKRSGADDYWALLGTKQIRNETKEYVPRYIAATMIANTPENYGFLNLDYHKPFAYDEITLEHPTDIDVIASCAGTKPEVIRELNPELRRWSTPANVSQYTIRIPAGTKETFISNIAMVPENERFTIDTYKVKKGDTLKGIAKKTGMPATAVLAMNSLNSQVDIKSGQVLRLPPEGKYAADLDDRVSAKKVSSVKRGTKHKKGKRTLVAKSKSKVKTRRA